jgi:hypothetical protein
MNGMVSTVLQYVKPRSRSMAISTPTSELRNRLRHELPAWLREDPEFREWLLAVTLNEFADRRKTESRLDRELDELRHNCKAQEHNWDEQNHKSDAKWTEQVAENQRLHADVMAMMDRPDCKIGALGALGPVDGSRFP